MTALSKKDREAVHERSWGRCEAHCNEDCTRWATQVHHKRGRRYNDLDLLLDVCLQCHAYLHAHPAESYERGWMIRRAS